MPDISYIYDWMKEHKDFKIYDDEHFLIIKYKDIPKEVYSSSSKELTESFIKGRINRLERELR